MKFDNSEKALKVLLAVVASLSMILWQLGTQQVTTLLIFKSIERSCPMNALNGSTG